MDFQDIYMKNYDILSRKDSNTLIKYYLETNNNYLKIIAKNVLINEGIPDLNVNLDLLNQFIDTLSLNDLSEFAKNASLQVRHLVEEKLSIVMNALEVKNNQEKPFVK